MDVPALAQSSTALMSNRGSARVTILVPTRNRAGWLKGAIEAALAQSFDDFDLRHAVEVAIFHGDGGVVRIGFDGQHRARRTDFTGEHHGDHSLMGADIEYARTGPQRSAAQCRYLR